MVDIDKKTRKSILARYRKTIQPEERVGLWASTDGFLTWAMENGYQPGAVLRKRRRSLPNSPGNCFFVLRKNPPVRSEKEMIDFVKQWNRAVNPIRRTFGMEPFPDPEEEEIC